MFKPKVPKKNLKKAADVVKTDPASESAQRNVTDESGFDLLRDRVRCAHPQDALTSGGCAWQAQRLSSKMFRLPTDALTSYIRCRSITHA